MLAAIFSKESAPVPGLNFPVLTLGCCAELVLAVPDLELLVCDVLLLHSGGNFFPAFLNESHTMAFPIALLTKRLF